VCRANAAALDLLRPAAWLPTGRGSIRLRADVKALDSRESTVSLLHPAHVRNKAMAGPNVSRRSESQDVRVICLLSHRRMRAEH
jgi:hypothetical protein